MASEAKASIWSERVSGVNQRWYGCARATARRNRTGLGNAAPTSGRSDERRLRPRRAPAQAHASDQVPKTSSPPCPVTRTPSPAASIIGIRAADGRGPEQPVLSEQFE